VKKFQLGEFEEVVMLTVGVLFDAAYGVSIKKEIETRLKRSVSVGALQTAHRHENATTSLDACFLSMVLPCGIARRYRR
jgi:hypothetical protein